jgi:hypothetical protein
MPKISELNTLTGLTSDDLLVVVNDPGGSPSTNKITFSNFSNSIFSNASSRTILPVSGNTQDLGSETKPWKNIYIGNGALYVDGTAISTPGTGTIKFVGNEMTTITNNDNLIIATRGTGELILKNVVFENFDGTSAAITYRDANTVGKYGGTGNSSIYLDIATVLNENGDYVIKGDGRFKFFTNDQVAVQNTDFGHIILRTENNDKFIKVHNVTDDIGIEIRTDDHSIQLAPNNYVWDFSPQGILNAPAGAQIKFSDNTVITSIRGPYVNDTAASSGGVALKSLYYDSSGNVKIRLT